MIRKILTLAAVSTLFWQVSSYAVEGCTLNSVSGDVKVMRAGQEIPAQTKDTLKKGDKLVTGASPSCTADMSMNDLAGCRVLPNSEVEVAGWKPENMSLNVISGNVILNLKKLPADSSFKVETPTAVAAVRGTQFWGRVEGSSDSPVTTFAVRQGEVDITDKASSQTFKLMAGQALDLPKTASAPPVMREALPGEMQAMEQADAIASQA